LVVKVLGDFKHLKVVGAERVGCVENADHQSVESGRSAVRGIDAHTNPMHRGKDNWQ